MHSVRTIVMGLCALPVLAGCAAPEPPASAPQVLRLRTGTAGGAFNPLGNALAREFGASSARIRLDPQQSAGSVSNVRALQSGEADAALAQADVVYMAYEGRLPEATVRMDRLRGIAVLYLNPMHFVSRAPAGTDITEQLRGRRVGFGSPGGGTVLLPSLLMGALGVPEKDVNLQLLPFDEAAERLSLGTMDAMFVFSGYPAAAVRTAIEAGARLVPIAGPRAQRILQIHPFFRATFIPGGTYPGYPEPVPTVGVDTLLVCRSDLDAELAYELTRTLFDVLPKLVDEQPALRSIDLGRIAATPIPLHPGAARYYREREIGR